MKNNLSPPSLLKFLSRLLLPLFIALASVTICHAGLYKGLDDEGNVAYSDKPFDNAKEIIPPAITIADPVKTQPKEVDIETPAIKEFNYKKFSISSPTDQQTIWNNPALDVSLSLNPSLNTTEGHKIWLFMDGKPIVKNSSRLTLTIGRADRGEHRLQAHIRNKAGKVIKQTKAITIHVKNTIIKRSE